MVDVLKVSRSGYYTWRQNGMTLSPRAIKRAARDAQILAFFDDSKKRYGAKRIQKDLAANNAKADIKTIMASMSRQGLVPKAAKKFKVTTDSNHKHPVAPNLLEQNFAANGPNQKWAGDITYLYTSEGWLYLAVII
jgi:transposase InsO family protein